MQKISVMLVDDEQLVLEDLKDIVDWGGLGFEIVAVAKNGMQALAKYIDIQPDLVITDIKMPGMDGVELARKIFESGLRPIVILLSAYGDFNYAKQALSYGVDDYILKNEINNDMLAAKLTQLRERIEDVNKMTSLLTKEKIADLMNGSAGKFDGRIDEFFKEKRYYFVVEKDTPCPFVMRSDVDDTNTPTDAEAFFRANITGLMVRTVAKIKEGRMLICIDATKSHSQMMLKSVLESQARKLLTELMRWKDESYTIYISFRKLSMYEFSKIYISRIRELDAKYFIGGGKVYDLMEPELCCNEQHAKMEFDRFLSMLNASDSHMVIEYIEKKYDELISNKSYEELLHISNAFYVTLSSLIEKHKGMELPDISWETNRKHWCNARNIKAWMIDRYSSAMKGTGRRAGRKLSATVCRAIDYISENYGSINLKLDKIAESAGISSSRLSVLFKNEMNCTVNEYITSFRIWKAQLLLREGKFKVYEVADMVGYGTSQYFSQIFYQKVGISPKEFSRGTSDA